MEALVAYGCGELYNTSQGTTNEHDSENGLASTLQLPGCETVVQAKQNLKSEVLELIAKHNDEHTGPPFSAAELLVMGAICLNPDRTPIHDIYRWIVDTFTFYRNQAMEEYLGSLKTGTAGKVGWALDLHAGLNCWDAPLMCADKSRIISRSAYQGDLAVPTAAARIFLQKWLEQERDGTFRFLELPAELRNQIYEMALSLPRSGIFVGWKLRPDRACFKQREVDVYMDNFTRNEMSGCTATADAPMRTLLALLSVNQQIYAEAMPVFYDINRFYSRDMGTFSYLYRGISECRWRHVKDLVLEFGFEDLVAEEVTVKEWVAMTEALSTLRLRHIRITYEEYFGTESWKKLPKSIRQAVGRSRCFTEPCQLPGLRSLAVACYKAEAFKFESDCPLIEDYIVSAVRKLKAGEWAEEAPAKSSKRSKKGVSVGG